MTYDPEYQKAWYEANKEAHKAKCAERSRKYKKETREWIQQLKESTPCTDCGLCYPYYVMQYDHIGDKIMPVSVMITRGWSKAKIQAEIDKCELVCANCHATRTWTRSVGKENIDGRHETSVSGGL